MSEISWYGVRCIFRHQPLGVYEERILIWEAKSPEEAILRAEAEAADYCEGMNGITYVDFVDSFRMFDKPADGTEVFSLMRKSSLRPKEYTERFFDTGAECSTEAD